jgi:hypothetical protein
MKNFQYNRKLTFTFRALELALKFRNQVDHLDTVIAYRNRYLQRMEKEEKNPEFLKHAAGVSF